MSDLPEPRVITVDYPGRAIAILSDVQIGPPLERPGDLKRSALRIYKGIWDTGATGTVISKKVVDGIPHLESERGAFITSELLIKAKKSGFKFAEVPITHYPRTKGKGTGRKLNVIIKSFIDLLKLWKKLK